MRVQRSATVVCLLALGVATAELGNGAELLTFNVRDETAPAGGFVQMKVMETEATPISGGRPRMSFDAALFDGAYGVGLFAPTGEVAGAAVRDGNALTITYVTTTPFTGGEYPVLTVSLRVRPDVAVGTRGLFTLEPASIWTIGGATIATKQSTGRVTVGGSLAITNVVPGGGRFPPGTVVSVRGVGFRSDSRLRLNGNRLRAARVVSPTEIQFTLSEATEMAGAELRVDSGSESRIYYSYLRGIRAATSARPLLSITEPVFSGLARTLATVGPLPAMNPAYAYAALALQNPNLARADMTLEVYTAGGLLHSSPLSLESGHRLALELSELLGGLVPPPGASLRVTSSLPVQAFGLVVDERIRTVTPRLPIEAAP